jgi:two-component sensor histidine kinase
MAHNCRMSAGHELPAFEGRLLMLSKVGVTQRWPLWVRLTTTGLIVVAIHLFQVPLERHVPGEPFLPFYLVVIASTLLFGASAGFVAAAMTTVLSVVFFEPFGLLVLNHAADLIKVEVYGLLATASVLACARLSEAYRKATLETAALRRHDEQRSLLLSELAHGVANNFAGIAALIALKSASVRDPEARAVLAEAIDQVRVMGRLHARLRGGDQKACLDSKFFLDELCNDLRASAARGRPIAIECKADALPLGMDQAAPLGLIVNELVTNAIKHAFPDGRPGRVRVSFEARSEGLNLCVEDDGVGLRPRTAGDTGTGKDLVAGLASQLGGQLQFTSTRNGCSFRVAIPHSPLASLVPSTQSAQSTIH